MLSHVGLETSSRADSPHCNNCSHVCLDAFEQYRNMPEKFIMFSSAKIQIFVTTKSSDRFTAHNSCAVIS